jgi:uncharacterized membrane protein
MLNTTTEDSWANTSKVFAVIGGVICIFGGLSLVGLKAQGANSMIESIANGMGYYFIGKGVYMISMVMQFRTAIQKLFQKTSKDDA